MHALLSLLVTDRFLLAVIVLVAVEGGVLVAWQARIGHPERWRPLVSFLGAGFLLMVAMLLRPTEAGESPYGFVLAMLAALASHAWHVAFLVRAGASGPRRGS